jgi:uncharacterized RDD family membrane protein YckC
MFCTECGAAQAADARFCARCGHRLAEPEAVTTATETQTMGEHGEPSFCRTCYTELDPGEAVCSECGQPVEGRDAPTTTAFSTPGIDAPTVAGPALTEPPTVAAETFAMMPTAAAPPGNSAAPETAAAMTLPRVPAPPMTPEPYRPHRPAGPPVASFGARLGARLLDGLVLLAVLVLAAATGVLAGALVLNSAGALAALVVVALVYAVTVFAATAILWVGGEGNRPGQTLGKAACGIRVVRDDAAASRAGYGPAFGRFFLNLVPVLGLLSCLSMLWTPDRRCWHDTWTGTRVEKSPVPARARGNRWSPAILATCLALVVSLGTVGLSAYLTHGVAPYAAGDTGYGFDTGGSGTGSGNDGTGGSGAEGGAGGGGPVVPDFGNTSAGPEEFSDLVTIGTAARSNADAEPIADLLDNYFTAINDKDYGSYRATQAADVRADLTESQFTRGYASTTDSDATLVDIVDTPDGGEGAELTFTSEQDAADGPDGQTCTDWTLTYTMVYEGDSWRIDGLADGLDHSHDACE